MILFARTRHIYDSYTDFWTLVKLSGFQTCYVDEVNLATRDVYITTMHSHEWENMIAGQPVHRKAHLILWNLERPAGWLEIKTVGAYNDRCHMFLGKRRYDEIWVSDRRLAAETELRFVVLGSHPDLGEPGTEKVYDFCHMSVQTNRRQSIYKKFVGGVIGPNCWGQARHEVLQKSKFALNVHQDDHPFQEPLRFALFAAYGLPILSETIFDSHPWHDYMVYDRYPNLVGHLTAMLGNRYERWRLFGLKARQRMTIDFEFGKMVREAVFQTTGVR